VEKPLWKELFVGGNMTNKLTQRDKILKHLQLYGTITSLEAVYKYGILDGRKRISELRRMGHNITSTTARKRDEFNSIITYNIYKLENDDVRRE
jgi:hypothetical protein